MEAFRNNIEHSVEILFIVVMAELTILINMLIAAPSSTKFESHYLQQFPSKALKVHQISKSWGLSRIQRNKLLHILMGNRRLGYNIAVWNCRKGLLLQDNSPSEKLTDIESLLLRHDLHLLGILESDLHGVGSRVKRANPISSKEILENLQVKGYSIKLPRSWISHSQARILLYVRDGVHIKLRELANQDSDLPSISCEVGLGKEKKTCVNFCYREWTGGVSGLSDNQSQLERLSRQIRHWRSLYTGGRDVVIMGDTNLCALKWLEQNYQYKNLAEQIQDFLMEKASFQLVKKYTRSEISKDGLSRSCLDHCYSDVPEKLSGPIIEPAGTSDHLAVIVTKYTKAPVIKPQTVRKRTYRNFCIGSFLTDINNSDINREVAAEESIEEAAKVFQEKFSEILNHHAPMKTFQMRKNYLPQLSSETKLLMAERSALQDEATITGSSTLLKEFKYKAREVKKSVKKDKKEHLEKNMGEDVSVNHLWKTARDFLGIEKNLSPSVIRHGDGVTSNPNMIANTFNNYFLEKVKKLRMKTAEPPTLDPIQRLKSWMKKRPQPPPQFKLKELNLKDLRKILKRMKGKRSYGVDDIDSYSIKLAGPLIEEALLHLINLSIKKHTFAGKWKPQLIFPLHKKGGKLDVENYRPVSHLVEIGKMVEYAVYVQVVDHFTENDLFHGNHHGSLSGHSTATALIQVVDMWLEAAEKKQLSATLLLDQSAAYDLVDHQILLDKLRVYNFDESAISWFYSYLSNRTQIVQVESKQSKPCYLEEHAVPQGSILRGLIFIIFSNDFPDCNDVGESVLYVDDDTDVVHDHDPDLLLQKVQRQAARSAGWLKDNRMCVSGDKSKLLVNGTKMMRSAKLTRPMEIQVDNKLVMETKSEKLLGVIINNEMTWTEHLYGETWRAAGNNAPGLIPQLTQRVGILRRLSKYMTKTRLKLFSHGLFYSKLNYCLPVFGNVFGLDKYRDINTRFVAFTREDSRRLQVLQNSVMRLLTGSARSTPTTKLLELTSSLSVQQLVASQTLIMVHKVIQKSKPTYLARRLQVSRNYKIAAPAERLSITRGGFISRGVQLFNNLPYHIRSEQNLKKFRAATRTWVIGNISARSK